MAVGWILESPESMYVVWGADLHFFSNDAYRPVLGPRETVSVGSVLPDLWPDAWDAVKPFVEKAFQGRSSLFENMLITMARYGQPEDTWWSFSYSPLRDEAGSVVGVMCITNETTAAVVADTRAIQDREKLVELLKKELHDSRDFARLALSAVGGVGVWTYEVDVDKFYFDAAIAELYDLNPADGVAGLPRVEFLANVHSEDLSSLSNTMSGGLLRPGDLELEYRLVHADGSVRWVLSKGHTYFAEGGKPYRRTGVGVDMTNKRVLEEQLRQSQKMEAVGQLTGGIAHDFNNLLAGIIGSLDLLERRISTGRLDNMGRYINGAQTSAKRAAALTQRLLAFSRRQTLAPRAIDVADLADGMDELISRTVGPSIELKIEHGDGLWLTHVDPSQLENAILNLSINARDAQPEGGSIIIRAENVAVSGSVSAALGLPVGDYVALSVADVGTGMPASVIARAYDPFFTTKPLGQGTGLGLSMIHGFVVQSGGQVDIRSIVGSGTTITLYLPRYHGTVAAPSIPEPAAEHAGKGETILLIDDEVLVRETMAEFLREQGYHVIEADDGPSGLKILDLHQPINLLVTDVGLPGGLNGRQVAEVARQIRPTLKVIFVTGYAANSFVGTGKMEDGMHVVTKPLELDSFAKLVASLVERS
jgi:signal transduction histidine kinase